MNIDLFGNETPGPAGTAAVVAPAWVNNDTDEVQAVLRLAIREGYAVIGAREHVYSTPTKSTLSGVSGYEADLVRQLLDAGWLKAGATRTFHDGVGEVSARPVLVPATTRSALNRWAGLIPLPRRGGGPR